MISVYIISLWRESQTHQHLYKYMYCSIVSKKVRVSLTCCHYFFGHVL